MVTLDVTEQEQARSRSEELLREMTSILESTVTGIAHLRGEHLVRCNHRFEAMLGLPAGVAAGRSLAELFGAHPKVLEIATEAQRTLAEGEVMEAEFEVAPPGHPVLWYGLSVRRSGDCGAIELIAVLSTSPACAAARAGAGLRDRELMFSLSEVGIASVRGPHPARQRRAGAAGRLAGRGPRRADLSTLYADPADYARRWPQQERELRAQGAGAASCSCASATARRWGSCGLRPVQRGELAAGFIASFVNVDARHRAELAVALQAERTRAILDSVLVGIVTVGAAASSG